MAITAKENSWPYIAFNCHVSLASFGLQFLSLCLAWHWHFWRKLVSYFVRCPLTWFVWCFCIKLSIQFQIIEIQITHFGQECHKRMCSQCIILEDPYQLVPLLVMINFSQVSAGFLQCKVTILSFNVSCWEILWDCVNILLLLKLSSTRFSIHWWFLAWINCYACQMVIFLIPIL